MSTKNHFLIQVKANAPRLLKDLKQITQIEDQFLDSYFTREKVNGRIDCRIVEVFEVKKGQISKDWKGIKRVIRVSRWNENASGKPLKSRKSKNYKKTKSTDGLHYYIIDTPLNNVIQIARAIRQHWWIENKLHWRKDMYLQEDKMTIVDPVASPMVAALNNLVLNSIQMAEVKQNKAFFERIVNNIDEIIRIIRT